MGGLNFKEAQVPFAGVGVLQSAQLLGEALKVFPSFFAVFDDGEAFEFFGEFDGETFFGKGGDAMGALFGIRLLILRREFTQANATFFLQEPILEAAAPPLGEVVFRNGPSGEAGGENGLDFGRRIQPGGEFPAERAVVKAAV